MKRPSQDRILLFALSVMTLFFTAQSQVVAAPMLPLVPVSKQTFGCLLNPTLDPNYDANAPANANPASSGVNGVNNIPVNCVIAVYDPNTNVTWMSDNHVFHNRVKADFNYLSMLIGKHVDLGQNGSYTITANDFWFDDGPGRWLTSFQGAQAWIDSLNENQYLGVTGWTMAYFNDAQSIWTLLTTDPNGPSKPGKTLYGLPNQTAPNLIGNVNAPASPNLINLTPSEVAGAETPCIYLTGFIPGCGYYDYNVGPFAYLTATSWSADRINPLTGAKVPEGYAAWWNWSSSPPGGQLTSAFANGTGGLSNIMITPGDMGENQASSPGGNNNEQFSSPLAVIRCNVFNAPVPGKPANYGRCDNH